MLILTRRIGESRFIGGDITIKVVARFGSALMHRLDVHVVKSCAQ